MEMDDSIPMLAIHEDQDRDPWAPPRQVIRERAASFFVGDQQSLFAKAGFSEYHWRERKPRSSIYRATLIRLRELGWSPGKKKEPELGRTKGRAMSPENLAPATTDTGAMMREARIGLGMNMYAAAEAVGYSSTAYGGIESGKRLPQPRKLAGIAKGLGIDFQTLCDTVEADRERLGRRLGTASHKTYHPAPDEPGEINRRVVMDYLVDDMDFDKKKVADVVPRKEEYTSEDIREYIDTLLKQ